MVVFRLGLDRFYSPPLALIRKFLRYPSKRSRLGRGGKIKVTMDSGGFPTRLGPIPSLVA
jgi:hypothetical protein